MNKALTILILSSILLGLSYISEAKGVINSTDIKKEDALSDDWEVVLSKEESAKPDLYKSYMIIVKNKSNETKDVKIEIEQPVSANSKFFSEPVISELESSEFVELGRYFILNNHPKKFNVILTWEENSIKYTESLVLEDK
ncbi:hypothetical protein KDN24_00515 [Bacillus sp. Bva_UNVM-123]|uniref:hypothetical protein n=1 Tax=Bacillus sp. Bva_UNVM-123 TaxID=2829798 RepID=UPI00391F3978